MIVPEQEPAGWLLASRRLTRTTAEVAVEHGLPFTIDVDGSNPSAPHTSSTGTLGVGGGEEGVFGPPPPPHAVAIPRNTAAATRRMTLESIR